MGEHPRHNDPRDLDAIRAVALPFDGASDAAIDLVLQQAGDARLVLLGEASHGTHEFYKLRADITKRLIRDKGFHAVAVEADWPDAYRVNQFVRGVGEDPDAATALAGFRRFPAWMWRNQDVLDFVTWLRQHNQTAEQQTAQVGFYGLDLYSLFGSIEQVIGYLERVDPEAALRARSRYACFDHFARESEAYGMAMRFGAAPSCEQEVVAQLVEFQRNAAALAIPDGARAAEELFQAEQNARVARNAERYYRIMFGDSASSWNVRDQHMVESLNAVLAHLDARVGRSKVVVWAHNSHLGDARATQMGAAGEVNLGQLVREQYTNDCLLVGFTTYKGTVTAASQWGGSAELKHVRPALPASYEALFHGVGLSQFVLPLRHKQAARALSQKRLERAIGVIYLPQTERFSHYFFAELPSQFDVMIHVDETSAVKPLETHAPLATPEEPETFPSGV